MAQSVAETPTTAVLQERLKTLEEATDTKHHTVSTARKGGMKLTKANDLVNVTAKGAFSGPVDGGGGNNVLRLGDALSPRLAETRNFEALHVTKNEWEHTGNFGGWAVIEAQTKLVNIGHIDGQVGVLGTFDNKGVVANRVIVEPDAHMTNSGTVNGAVHVREKARFSGSGSVEFLSVAGQLKVGPEIGAPSINGNLELLKDAELIYGIDAAGASATINVAGTATLNDATLRIDAVEVENMGTSQHTVIRAKQIEGKFGTVIDNLPFMTATPHYNGTEVGLAYARNDVPLKAAAKNENAERFTGGIEKPQRVTALPPKPVGNVAVFQAPATLPKVDSPAQHPSKTQPVASTEPKPNAAITALLGTNMTTAADAIDQLSGYDTADLGNATLSSVAPIATGLLSTMGRKTSGGGQDNGQVWVQAVGHNGSLAKQLGSYAMKHSTKGVMLGTDWAISPDWRLGIIGGKTQTRLDSHQFEGALDSWLAGAYALRQDGPLALRLGAVYGSHDGSTKRHVAFNRYRDNLKGSYEANTHQVFGQVGYRLNIAHLDIEPYAHLGYQRYQRERYSEKGGDAAVQYNDQTQDHYSTDLGLRLARPFTFDQGMALTPRLDVSWRHLYGDIKGSSQQRLISGGNTYRIEGVELDRDSLLVQAGLDLAVSPRHILGLSYRSETGQDNRSGSLMGQWRMMF